MNSLSDFSQIANYLSVSQIDVNHDRVKSFAGGCARPSLWTRKCFLKAAAVYHQSLCRCELVQLDRTCPWKTEEALDNRRSRNPALFSGLKII